MPEMEPKRKPEERVQELMKSTSHNVAVCAVQVLNELLSESEASTFSQLLRELDTTMQAFLHMDDMHNLLSLRSGCELFKRYILRINHDNPDFEEVKRNILHRSDVFYERMASARQEVARCFIQWIQDEMVILLHGHSRTVIDALCHAAARYRSLRMQLYVTESLPDDSGMQTISRIQKRYAEICAAKQVTPTHGFSFKLVRDAAVASVMSEVNFVLTGAEGVVESGGIINKIGTYQVALIARALNKPFYVAAESFKFARIYPLNQNDIPQPQRKDTQLQKAGENLAVSGIKMDNRFLDYTPPELITLLFTDLGVQTAAAVSDELIKLYHEPLLTL